MNWFVLVLVVLLVLENVQSGWVFEDENENEEEDEGPGSGRAPFLVWQRVTAMIQRAIDRVPCASDPDTVGRRPGERKA